MNKFKIGDMVKVLGIHLAGIPDIHNQVGIIRIIDGDDFCGIEFEGWHDGHSCCNCCHSESSGIWISYTRLELYRSGYIEF